MLVKPSQHRPLLFHLDQALHRRIGDRDFNRSRISNSHNRNGSQQEKQSNQEDRNSVFRKIHPLYLISPLA